MGKAIGAGALIGFTCLGGRFYGRNRTIWACVAYAAPIELVRYQDVHCHHATYTGWVRVRRMVLRSPCAPLDSTRSDVGWRHQEYLRFIAFYFYLVDHLMLLVKKRKWLPHQPRGDAIRLDAKGAMVPISRNR